MFGFDIGLSLTAQGSRTGVAKTVTALGGNRFQAATGTLSIANNFTSRRSHYASGYGAISDLVFVETCWYMENIATPARTIKKYVEYPAGVFTPVTWDGNLTVTIASGGQAVSDPCPVTIPAGAKFWERTVNVSGAAVTFPITILPYSSSSLGVDDGNANGDLGNSGTIVPTSTANTYGATAMYATVHAERAPSVLIVGDSIAWGQNDTGRGKNDSSGWIARLLDESGTPYVKLAKQGAMAHDLAAASNTQVPLINVLPFTHVICEYGVNDLRSSRTRALIEADWQTIYGLMGDAQIIQTTITPRSDSTDGYASVDNQTPKTDGTMASLSDLNADVRNGLANVDHVLDIADVVMSARDSGVWLYPPVMTSDGTHPSDAAIQLIVPALKDTMASLLAA